MMVDDMRNLLLTFVFSFIWGLNCFAACDPVTDPCAPKKDLNAWQKSLAFGYNATSGNSDTSLFTALSELYKETASDAWKFNLAYSFGEDKNRTTSETEDDLGDTTRNDLRTGGNYKYSMTERTFAGFDSNLLYDEVAEIDYRITTVPTLGYYFLKDADFNFFGEAGPGYIFEKVGGVDDDYLAPKIGEGFTWTISCTSKIFQKANVLVDVNDSDNYLVNAELGVESALSSMLSLVFLARETYDNQPAEGLEKEDLAIITALKVAL